MGVILTVISGEHCLSIVHRHADLLKCLSRHLLHSLHAHYLVRMASSAEQHGMHYSVFPFTAMLMPQVWWPGWAGGMQRRLHRRWPLSPAAPLERAPAVSAATAICNEAYQLTALSNDPYHKV